MTGFRLDGQVAVVTGGGRGIGRGCVVALADAGAHVVALSRTEADLEKVVAEVAGRGGSAEASVCDVTDRDALAAVFSGLPQIDVLVNSAGTNNSEDFVDVGQDSLRWLIELNVKATFIAGQLAARAMLASGRGGSIVNLSSQLGHVGFPRRTLYAMTKHAVEGLTKAMAVELAPSGIRVNAVAPTFVVTPMTEPLVAVPGFTEQMTARIPLGRLGRVDDVAAAVVFLASPAASLVTGTSLRVDGGWTAQ